MHRAAIHPQLHGIGPPAQHEPGLAIALLLLTPGRRAEQLQAQLLPQATAGPDQQAAGMPVGPVARAPGIGQGRAPGRLRCAWFLRLAEPEGQEIQTRLGLKRFNPGVMHGLGALRRRSTRSCPIG